MSWTPSKHLIRKIRKGKSKEVTFRRLESGKDIKLIGTTCSCTDAKYNPRTQELVVTYTAKFPQNKTLPIHVTTQVITVKYEDDTVDKLQIQANVYR